MICDNSIVIVTKIENLQGFMKVEKKKKKKNILGSEHIRHTRGNKPFGHG